MLSFYQKKLILYFLKNYIITLIYDFFLFTLSILLIDQSIVLYIRALD